MDQKLLDALNNLSDALEMISDALKDKKGGDKAPTTQALQSGDFSKQITSISIDVKSIKKDTQEILKHQKTILSISQKKSEDGGKKSDIIGDTVDKKSESALKNGVGTIILIAVGILAIGMALKVIGKVDLMSVVALGIAIVLVAVAFERVFKLNISTKQAFDTSKNLVIISIAVMISSFALGKISKVDILSMFVMSVSIVAISFAFERVVQLKITNKQAFDTGKNLVIISIAIMLSSWILGMASSLSIAQAMTAILIAGLFAVISFSITKMITALGGSNIVTTTKGIIYLPLLLPAIAAAITVSSWFLKMVSPISFPQAITSILIAGLFTVISFGINKMVTALGGANIGGTMKSIMLLPLLLPAIALGIAASSLFLNMVSPISFAQGITAILIAGVFTVISFGIGKMITALGGAGLGATTKSIMFLPLLLPAIALGIAASSWILKMISPISFAQALTAIFIAAMFTVISFGLKKLISSFQGIDPGALLAASIMIPILLPALAFSIAASSWALSTVKPISFAQFLTSLAISLLFIVVSYAVSIILKATKEIKIGDVIKIPLLFVTMSMAIYLSSIILNKAEEIKNDKLWSILKFGVVLSFIGVVMSAAFWVIKKMGIGITDVIKGSLIILALATTIMLSSHILSLGKYEKYPSFTWALGVGASILAFGISAIALGVLMATGVGAIALGLGAVAILGIAGAIVATDKILSKGNFTKYPSIGWAIGVGLLITTFGLATMALGAFILGTLGLGGLALKIGANAVKNIAQSIVDTSTILAAGNFTKYPSIGWAIGVGLLITTFGLATMALGGFILGTLGFGGMALEKGGEAVTNIAQSIVDTAAILKMGDFTGGPKKEWAKGVSLAIGAFAPVYAMLMADGIMKLFGGGGISPEDFSAAIKTISEGILYSAKLFAGTEGIFTGGPSKKWAEGVGTAIGAFAPVLNILMADGVLKIFGGGIDPRAMKSAIRTISEGIVEAAEFFRGKSSLFEKGGYPSAEWGKNVGLALAAFAPVYAAISGKGWFEDSDDVTSGLTKGIKSMAEAIVSVATSFSDPKVSWTAYPTAIWSKAITSAVMSYIVLSNFLSDKEIDDIDSIKDMADSIVSVATSFSSPNVSWTAYPTATWSKSITSAVMSYIALSNFLSGKEINNSVISVVKKIANVAKILGSNQFVNNLDPNFMKGMMSNVRYYIVLTKELTKSAGGLAGMAKSALFGDPITNAAKGMVKLAGAYDKLASSLTKFSTAISLLDPKKINSFKELSNIVAESGSKKNESLVNAVTGAFDSAISGVGDFLSSIPGPSGLELMGYGKSDVKSDKAKVTAAKPGTTSKYGDMGNQLDVVIDLLTKLNESTKSLDVYLKEKMGGEAGSDVTSSSSSSSSSWF